MDWYPVYDPLQSFAASALVALVPFFLMFALLAYFQLKSYVAGASVLVVTLVLAVGVWRYPAGLAGATTAYGALFGLFPIGYIILASIFLYNLAVSHGQVDTMRQSLELITGDRRLQGILIAFAFGALLDATAGFLTPVSVAAAVLLALGFRPLLAAQSALLGCALPAAVGAMGVPVVVTAKVTGFDPVAVTRAVSWQLWPLVLLVPFILAGTIGGFWRIKEVWFHAAAAGVAYGLALVGMAQLGSPYTAGLVSAIAALGAFTLACRTRSPTRVFRFAHDPPWAPAGRGTAGAFRAWFPFVLLAPLVTAWKLPATQAYLERFTATVEFSSISGRVFRVPPVVLEPEAVDATLRLNFGSSAGTAIVAACLITQFYYGTSRRTLADVAHKTARQLYPALLTMATVFGATFVLNYSGMGVTLGLALAGLGFYATAAAPYVTAMGAFLTGSNTAANAMFSGLLVASAHRLGVPALTAVGAGSAGAVVGKMIAPQCLAAAAAAAGVPGEEGTLLARVAGWALLLTTVAGVGVLFLTIPR
ncbi:MAG: L-lactate permease [Bacillota bacterium]